MRKVHPSKMPACACKRASILTKVGSSAPRPVLASAPSRLLANVNFGAIQASRPITPSPPPPPPPPPALSSQVPGETRLIQTCPQLT